MVKLTDTIDAIHIDKKLFGTEPNEWVFLYL